MTKKLTEWERDQQVLRDVEKVIGLAIADVIGYSAFMQFGQTLIVLSLRARRLKKIEIDPKNHLELAAVHLLCEAGHLRRIDSSDKFVVTD